ncbi:hypothetical protein LVD15_06265 [Fulvivirga maritima]|uniref:hypothetical protein n=1 Tax=Fulvivirga maritima TaxID=2904247 RepID=UPI001F476BC8|nr:hypothetical protein [Fulvivirga maritima]UII28026.1 hypothetical protein LVD15_06265 [Fulvivirga maritima]
MEYENLYDVISYIMIFSAVASLLIGLRDSANISKFVLTLVFFSFLLDLIFAVCYDFFGVYIPYHGVVYRIIELLLLVEFYKRIFKFRKIFILAIIELLILAIFCYSGFNNNYLRVSNSILFSVLSALFFIKYLREMEKENPLEDSLFWINSGFLIYFSGFLFISLFFELLSKIDRASAVISYMFHNLLGVVKNICLAYGFWVAQRKSREVGC